MQIETAKEIVELTFNNKMIQAIKLLRADSAMGLIAAKHYLEENRSNRDELLKKLCDDFVKNKIDLLRAALYERHLLTQYIEKLEAEIAEEGGDDGTKVS
jgi:hypothetical protein